MCHLLAFLGVHLIIYVNGMRFWRRIYGKLSPGRREANMSAYRETSTLKMEAGLQYETFKSNFTLYFTIAPQQQRRRS
jgi:hypothetical protein